MDNDQTAAGPRSDKLRTSVDTVPPLSGPAWLPLADAAQRLGVSTDAVRKRARRGLVEARKGNDGRVVVLITGQTASGQGPDSLDTDDELLDEAEAERWRRVAEERGLFLARAEAGLAAQIELAAELRRVIEHERARADRLEAELRRPWWRRLIG